MAKASRWIPLFKDFIKDLRISSKEVSSEDDRGTKLVPMDSQKRFLEEVGSGLDDGIRVFKCLKSRQLGITTISLAIDVFWLAMHKNLSGALVSDTEKNRDINRATIRRYIQSFPEGYFGDSFSIVKGGDNRQFMRFSNGARLDFLVAGTKKKSSAWGEGVGYAFVHLTELASYGDQAGLLSFEESFAQQATNRLFIYESTAKGHNHWYTSWTQGLQSTTERSFFIGWWASKFNEITQKDPRWDEFGGYPPVGEEKERVLQVAKLYGHRITPEQLCWIRWREATSQDTEMLEQNQPWVAADAFRQTGYSFFQVRQVNLDIRSLDAQPELKRYNAYRYDYGNSFFDLKMYIIEDEAEKHLIELKVWEEPVENGKYVIGFDPAWGRNEHKDRSCITIWRCFADRVVQVACYATADVEVKQATWVLAHLAGAYEDCIVNVELSGPGRTVMSEFEALRGMLNTELYEGKVKARNWEAALHNARWYLYNRPDTMGAGYLYNFESGWRTVQELMHTFRGAYMTREVDMRDLYLLYEMLNVVQDNLSIGAPESRSENAKDDRVFAAALAVMAWNKWRKPELIAAGETYEKVMQIESGELPVKTQALNDIVYRFLKNKQDLADNPPDERPQWLVDRGLA